MSGITVPTQSLLQTEMRALFAKAKMPSSPALAAKIIELAENPNSTVEQFADLIQMDPALSGRLLRMTNSAACAQRVPVTTIKRAVALLGINRVRTVSLGFQLVSHLNRLGSCPFDMQRFWQASVLRACLAQEIAQAVPDTSTEEAFLIGLLQDCGIITLVQMLGQPYAKLCTPGDLTPLAFYAAERERFPHNHVEAIGVLAREWRLPDRIIANLERQHAYTRAEGVLDHDARLAAISFLAGSTSFSESTGSCDADLSLIHEAREDLELSEDDLRQCIEHAAESYEGMAELLGDVLPDDLDVSDLLSTAIQFLSSNAEDERREAIQKQETLQNALGDYREKAARDPLTGVLNRGALTDALRAMLQRAAQPGESVTVLFIDLDNFKKLNDTLGHQVGDEVLKGASQSLAQVIPNAGFIGRYGGEEFLLGVLGLTEKASEELAQNAVSAVRNTPFEHLGIKKPVTGSVGVVWCANVGSTMSEALVAKADELMYDAKRSGKDRYRFQALDEAKVSSLRSENAGELPSDLVESLSPPLVDLGMLRNIAIRLNQVESRPLVNQRKSTRKPLVVPCRLTFLRQPNLDLVTVDAYSRNISTGGIAVVAAAPLVKGQPTEVAVPSTEKPEFYVAGVVAFCRHIEQTVHEIGLQVFTHKTSPILSHDPISALRELDWVAGAVQALAKREASMGISNVPTGAGTHA